jgi:hypothetical protein
MWANFKTLLGVFSQTAGQTCMAGPKLRISGLNAGVGVAHPAEEVDGDREHDVVQLEVLDEHRRRPEDLQGKIHRVGPNFWPTLRL